MRSFLYFSYIILSPVFAQDFVTACNDLTDGTSVKSLYYRSTCYVVDTAGKNWHDTKCQHLDRPGYLAILPGTTLLQVLGDYFGNTYFHGKWIGMLRNETNSPTSLHTSREYYYWQGGGGKTWKAEPDVTNWYPGEPNDGGIPCGLVDWALKTVLSYHCTAAYGSLCQYRAPQMAFKQYSNGLRAIANQTIEEHTLQHHLQCATKCHGLLPCQSYTFSPASGLCALQLLPAIETSTEPLNEATMFDLI